MKLSVNVPCVDTKRAAPADWTERAARRAAPKDLAIATMMAVLEVGVEMERRWVEVAMDGVA